MRDHPELQSKAARWFSDKWGVPTAAYHASIGECIARKSGIPQWYAVLDERGEIVAGAGVIANDFTTGRI